MESKEKILLRAGHFAHLRDDDFNALIVTPKEAFEAMDTHARNCMIEFLKYYAGWKDTLNAEKIVDGFLQSEYFKELQK